MSRSIQQLPNNSGTTSVTEVYTSTGFNAGDPVYFQNGDYKSPANLTAPSTVNFSFPETAAIDPAGLGGIIAPSFTFAQMQNGVSGGSSRRFAAVLTSGNIVQVWMNYTQSPATPNLPYFRIITPSNTIVVSPTVVSSTFTNSSYSAISVVALVGGGFAMGWVNSAGGTSNSVNYAIYSNTGVVVTAATQDTSFSAGASYFPIEMTSLANGGFAIAIKDSSAVIYLRAYSSTGVGSYSTINTGITAQGNEISFALTARSDSSVFVCDRIATSGPTYQYALFNSGGSAIVGATSFNVVGTLSQGTSGFAGPDASVQTDGTTIVIAFNGHNGTYGYPAFRFLPTGNVLSSETIAIPVANLFYQTGYNGGYLSVQCLSSNNFILYFADGYGNMQYAFYNSSGTCVSGSNGSGSVPIQITGGFAGKYSKITLLESSGYVYAYWTAASNQQKPVQQVFCKISVSSYVVLPISSVPGTTYTVTGVTAGALATSSVNPNSVSYYATTSSSSVSTNTPATVSGPTVISGINCDAIASCTLPNGNFVVAWRAASGYTIYASVYSSVGALLNTITVGTSTDGSAFTVKVAALTGGGFVVAFTDTNTTLTFTVYSSGYSSVATLTITIYSFGTSYNYDIAGMTDNNFVVGYSIDGTNGRFRVYNSSLTALQSFDYASNPQSFAAAGNAYGGFAVNVFRAGSGQTYAYVPTATNTWALSGTGSNGAYSAFVQNPQLVATESGMFIHTAYSGSYPSYGMSSDAGPVALPYIAALATDWPNGLGSTSNPTSYPMMGIGMTGNGNVVIATSYSGNNIGIACLPAQMTFSTGQPLPFKTTATNNVPMFSNNAYNRANTVYALNAQPRVAPSAGNNAIITFRGVGGYPNFMIVNGTSLSNVYPIIAGVTPSALTAIAPVANSSTIAGAFAGVAVTSATAGSTGQLATNGQALLGTSYTSTATGAFDGTGGALVGLKGTFNGRSVNLQGNL